MITPHILESFESSAAFLAFASNSPDFTPIPTAEIPPYKKSKITGTGVTEAFLYRGTQCVVFGKDSHGKPLVEARIIDPAFAITPAYSAIGFSASILERLAERHSVVEADQQRSTDIVSGQGWFITVGPEQDFMFMSMDVPKHVSDQIKSILLKHQSEGHRNSPQD